MRRNPASFGAVNLGICILAGCALIAAATFATADSQPRRQARSTHLGVAPSDIVELVWVGPLASQKFVRQNSDGTASASEYAVPSGMRFIVTDADWASNLQSGTQQMLRVWVENRASSTTRQVVCTRAGPPPASTAPVAGAEKSMTTGFTVGSGGRLVADQCSAGAATTTAFGTTSPTGAILLRGYVVVDE